MRSWISLTDLGLMSLSLLLSDFTLKFDIVHLRPGLGRFLAGGDGCRVQLSPYSHPFILIFVVIEKIFDLSPAISGPLILHQPSHY